MRPPARVKCQKRPPAKFFVKKDPLRVAAPTWHVPPGPVAAGPCRRCRCRHVVSGRPGGPCMCRHVTCRQWWWRHGAATSPAANGDGGMVLPPHLPPMVMAAWCCHLTILVLPPHLRLPHARVPPMATAAGACRQWPRRHVPRVAWPGVPPLVGGLFRQKFSQVVFSSISLAQVVSCVKNSMYHGWHQSSLKR
jgi:hypothetical protein